ncbi:MAG: PPC domain-containing protein [Dokdonella sp.]
MLNIKTRIVAGLAICLLAGGAFAANRSSPDFVPTRTGPVPAGGGSCGTPVNVTPLPYASAGNTCGGVNNITNYGGACGVDLPFPYGGPEDVYRITVGATNSLNISADLTGSTGDLALFLVGGTCGSGAGCIANSQDAIGAGAGPELIPAQTNIAAGTYFIYVDSYYAAPDPLSCGTYSLAVTGSLPVTITNFSID